MIADPDPKLKLYSDLTRGTRYRYGYVIKIQFSFFDMNFTVRGKNQCEIILLPSISLSSHGRKRSCMDCMNLSVPPSQEKERISR